MRVRRDATTWHARGVLRRDARHEHAGPEVSSGATPKNTRTWCRGKVGRNHALQCYRQTMGRPESEYFTRCCAVCGKEVARYYPSFQTKPDWVK